ncbi:MAG: lytic transglycosylase domain-containing protein [Actinomycetota bacterium]|nr:lytic transglycosylase domain-containing protein [Actinomycetota bacterium]
MTRTEPGARPPAGTSVSRSARRRRHTGGRPPSSPSARGRDDAGRQRRRGGWAARLVVSLAVVAAAIAGLLYVEETKPGWYARLRYPLAYEHVIRGHARNYDLDPALLAAVVYRESKFDVDARSRSGAIGLMQLLPETAKGIALHTGGTRFRVSDLYNPEINVRYGSFYLRRLIRKYDDARLGLAAYNAGQRNVDEWLEDGRGIAFGETREYVRDVLELRDVYARAYAEDLGLQAAAAPKENAARAATAREMG